MTISSSTNRTSATPRPAGADPTTAPAQQKAAGAASEATGAGKAEAPRTDQFVAAQAQGSTSRSLGPSTARPSKAMDLSKLVKPAESFLLRISETRGPQVAAEMRALDKSIDAKAKDGATALGPGGNGMAGAVDESTNRVLQRVAEGKVTPEEAKTAMDQLDLAAAALKAVKDGNMPGLRQGEVDLLDKNVQTLNFELQKGSDTYTVKLMTRPERSFFGDRAGMEFMVTGKNGQPLPDSEKVSLRMEHDKGDQKAKLFVSSELLDKKIHGPKLDDKGQPIPGCKTPNSEINAGLPETLNAPDQFAAMVSDLRKTSIDPKTQAMAQPTGIAFQTDNKVSLEAIGKTHGSEAAKSLAGLNDSIDALARQSSTALGPAGEAVAKALDSTTDRILGRVAQGVLSPQDAEKAMSETRLLASALEAIQGGKLQSFKAGGTNLADPNAKTYKFDMKVGEDTYSVKVATRSEAGQGEARLGFTISEKNGEKLGPTGEIGMRIDLAKVDGKAAVDIDSLMLDRKVHGAMDTKITNGLILPDHHFHDGVPEALSNPADFAKFVNGFRDNYMKAG